MHGIYTNKTSLTDRARHGQHWITVNAGALESKTETQDIQVSRVFMALKTFFFISEKNTMVQILGRIDSGDLSTREQHVRNFWIIPRKLLEKIDLQPVKPGICHRQP